MYILLSIISFFLATILYINISIIVYYARKTKHRIIYKENKGFTPQTYYLFFGWTNLDKFGNLANKDDNIFFSYYYAKQVIHFNSDKKTMNEIRKGNKYYLNLFWSYLTYVTHQTHSKHFFLRLQSEKKVLRIDLIAASAYSFTDKSDWGIVTPSTRFSCR